MRQLSSRGCVAMTGLGLVAPLGNGNAEHWAALLAGKSGIGPITRFDASRFTSRIAGEVKNFDPALYIEKKEIKKMDFFIHYAMAAAQFAIEDSGLPITDANRERIAVVVGSGIGGLPIIEKTQEQFVKANGNPKVISPFFITALIYAEPTGYGLSGDAYNIAAPSEDGDGTARVMKNALHDAEIRPEDIDYINAHGTSTPAGDRAETIAIRMVFGDHAKKLAVS